MNRTYFKKLLTDKNMTCYRVCKLTGISPGGLTDIVNGKIRYPRVDTLVKIGQAMSLTHDEFSKLCEYEACNGG